MPKLIFCKMVGSMPVTLSQMYVKPEEPKFGHKAGGCSDDFTKLLKTFCYETALLMSLGLLVVAPSALRFLSSYVNAVV